eukprot:198650_1
MINNQTKKIKRKKQLPPLRKLFIAFRIKRISSLDTETFRMRFHIYFTWIATESEYKSWYQAKIDDALTDWKPEWIPNIEIMNLIEEHMREWEWYPEEGPFRMQSWKDLGQQKGEQIEDGAFDCTKCKFIRAKLELDLTLAEEMELQSYPFDYQPLKCIIREKTRHVNLTFLPELRKPNFASFDPRYTKIDEWNIEGLTWELGTTNASSSRSDKFPVMVTTVMVSRRWKSVLVNTLMVIFLACLLSLTVFSIDFEDTSDRLGFTLTLLLTAVLFDTQSEFTPYLTFLDKYILSSYGYLTVVMMENSLGKICDPEIDVILMYVIVVLLIAQNLSFIIYAIYIRRQERLKLAMDIDQEEKISAENKTFALDYRNRVRSGVGGRLLAFRSTEIHDLFKQNNSTIRYHGYDPFEIPLSRTLQSKT